MYLLLAGPRDVQKKNTKQKQTKSNINHEHFLLTKTNVFFN